MGGMGGWSPEVRMARLIDFLGSEPPKLSALPLLHTTNLFSFSQICECDSIQPTYCKFLMDDLLYLFYGRPAYRTAAGNVGFTAKYSWPVVFAFRPEAVRGIIRVFPFDTGAFIRGMYAAFIDDRQKLDDFNAGNSFTSAQRIVEAFYRSNEEYFRNYSTKNVDIDEFDFTTAGIQDIIRSQQVQARDVPSPRDERVTSIEIQSQVDIGLLDGSLLAVILPQTLAANSKVNKAISRWTPQHRRYYETYNMHSYEAWHGQIYTLLREIYIKERYVDVAN